ncbi:M23 family metallopeptidase [Lentzea flava]|uniref:Peptidase M23 n=1 Tax=Lentzea flava TaxID=103732 RepID=A0ABQ2UT75_9PSEU|nr:M23 family metallopeptidase [Lentzea flava]MCP2201358.1 Peptidase family M23 [Lentzea flava]GGU51609.1 peptidase M23 [Lentzea flava]
MNVKRMLSAVAGLAISLGALVVTGQAAEAAPGFQMPFPCGQVWSGQTRGPGDDHPHNPYEAIDFNRADDEGDWVVASAAGKVSRVENRGNESYGRWIEINHGGGWATRYAHLSSQNVSVGQQVSIGQKIGKVGNTGGSTGAHLHFEQLQNGDPKRVVMNGQTALYYGTKNYKSNNCGGGGGGSTNPYTPEEVCGDGYKVIDGANVTGARISLLYNASNGYNCVVAIKTTKIGTASDVGAFLQVKGGTKTTDRDEYGYYAGPIRKKAADTCVSWGGQVGSSSYSSPFEHCG